MLIFRAGVETNVSTEVTFHPLVTSVSFPSTIVFVLALALGLLGLISTAVWTYLDAKARGDSWAIPWGISAVLVFPVLLLYLLVRDRLGERSHPPSRTQRVALVVLLGCLGTFVAGSVLSPPDPVTQLSTVVVLFPVVLAAAWLAERYWRGVLDRDR